MNYKPAPKGSPIKTSLFPLLVFCLAAPCLSLPARAQELKRQPTPFTTYLDLKNLDVRAQAFPIWLESCKSIAKRNAEGQIERTVFRLRFRQFAGINEQLLLRVYFDDTQSPVITAWTEIGERLTEPRSLGSGLGLPTSETLLLTMDLVDYVELEVPGDGANVSGIFLGSVQKVAVLSLLDFAASAELLDPFEVPPARAATGGDDSFLLGRVKATLESGTVVLSASNAGALAVEFELAIRPDLALLIFEILNADLSAPPQISVNDQAIGAASITAPDLADPGYQDAAHDFRYRGWLRVQKMIPGAALRDGLNQFTIQTPGVGVAVAIRAVEVQLKYDSRTR